MFGKETTLEKPFAVLEKQGEEDDTKYIVKRIVRRKIVFKIRPKPIVGN